MTTSASPPRAHWLELDVLRMLAVALMVANHAGVAWLSPEARSRGISGALTFAGSFAPVLFFCVTGMGRGIRAGADSAGSGWATWRKAGLLALADAAMWLSPTRWLGLDFLGFIALSSLVVDGIARRLRWRALTSLALLGCLALRFGVGPALGSHLPVLLESAIVRFVLGVEGVAGVSYPLSPWLAFPLLGMLAARFAAGRLTASAASRPRLVAGCAVAALVLGFACVALDARGAVFFRWGTMSFGYFVASIGVLAAAFVAGLALAPVASHARLRPLLTIGGSASLIVVPVHYGVVALLGNLWKPVPGGAFVCMMVAALVATVATARGIDRAAPALASARSSRSLAALWAVVIGGLLACALGRGGLPRVPVEVVVQIAVACLFVRASRPAARMESASVD